MAIEEEPACAQTTVPTTRYSFGGVSRKSICRATAGRACAVNARSSTIVKRQLGIVASLRLRAVAVHSCAIDGLNYVVSGIVKPLCGPRINAKSLASFQRADGSPVGGGA